MLTEGSIRRLFIVKQGVIAVPPLSHMRLPGLSCDALLEFARRQGASVAARSISEGDLHAVDEIWIASLSKELLAVPMFVSANPVMQPRLRERRGPWMRPA
ncbi:amino-transferase class IV [Pseudomonas sp. SJZ079]|uniref:aminotransferase class IV n=1 Tax=Pseudomonas sp. SJZ079 TaxID=2572887 RepID=UPI00119C2EE1|nr:aminotransferase class IV [Pseudomonas sp. SJZ079]TWC28033.1 amino-transferase class IV [Pseudomonas sp. SJZ079]